MNDQEIVHRWDEVMDHRNAMQGWCCDMCQCDDFAVGCTCDKCIKRHRGNDCMYGAGSTVYPEENNPDCDCEE